MSAVKGSKQYQYKVVRSRPGLAVLLAVVAVLLVITSVASAFWYGHHRGMAEQQEALHELAQAREQLVDTQQTVQRYQRDLENAKTGSEVDRQTLEEVRVEVTALREQIAELEEENLFYRNLMAPSASQRGLSFGNVEVSSADRPRTYRYKVVMQQLDTKHNLLNGSLNFNVIGQQDGTPAVMPLNALSEEVDNINIKLRFKYFQNIEGTMVLPEGFEPDRIELEARSTSPKTTTVSKRLDWLVHQN